MYEAKWAIAAAVLAAALATGCGGKTDSALDPANELPFGHLDTPPEGAHVPAQTVVGGWALDDRGIKEVRVYVDGHIVMVTGLNTDRPDVTRVFAHYAKGSNLHGWTTSVAFDAPGPHVILAQAVDSDGATRDLGTSNVTSADK